MADAGGLQLLPDTRKKIEYSSPGQNRLLVLSFVFIALVLGIYFGLKYYKDRVMIQLNGIDQKLVENEKARSKSDEDKLIRLKDSLAIVGPLLSGHILWSNALDHIQTKVLPQVQFDSLTVNTIKNEYVFKAYAASYSTVAQQIAVFYADNMISDLSIGTISSETSGKVEFIVRLVLDSNKISR